MFLGRDEEIKRINSELQTDDFRMILVFGRRRIGKSELIKHILKMGDIPYSYYECRRTSERSNVDNLAALIAEREHIPLPYFSSFEELLKYSFENARHEKKILVLDEYPYLRSEIKGLDSIIQALVDEYSASSKLKLIICGSFVDVMKSLIDLDAPLYGRITLTVEVKAMDYYDAAKFYPEYSPEEKVMMYGVFGGVPYYNRWIDAKRTAEENIKELIINQDSRFENEIQGYLSGELSKLENANEVFEALSKGFTKYSDILSQSHISSSAMLANVLDKLIRMQLVEKRAPINDENNKRKAGYYISDALSHFYYKYIFRYLSQRAVLDGDVFYDKYIKEDFLTQHIPGRFEGICREYLIRKNKAGNMDIPFLKIGKYYYDDPKEKTNGEFDVVTLDEHGYVFYEVKYKDSSLTKAMVEEEIMQVQKCGLAPYKYGFFVRSGFDNDVEAYNIEIIKLSELYEKGAF